MDPSLTVRARLGGWRGREMVAVVGAGWRAGWGRVICGRAVLARLGTNLLPRCLRGCLWLARFRGRGRRFHRGRILRFLGSARGRIASARGPGVTAHGRSGDPAFRDVRRRCDGRGRPGRVIRRLFDDFRSEMRRYSGWTYLLISILLAFYFEGFQLAAVFHQVGGGGGALG